MTAFTDLQRTRRTKVRQALERNGITDLPYNLINTVATTAAWDEDYLTEAEYRAVVGEINARDSK